MAAELENIHETIVRTGDRLELLQALELTVELLCLLESLAIDNLDRASRAQERAGEPDFAVAARTDAPEQFVVRNKRSLSTARERLWAGSMQAMSRVFRAGRLWLAWLHGEEKHEQKSGVNARPISSAGATVTRSGRVLV